MKMIPNREKKNTMFWAESLSRFFLQ